MDLHELEQNKRYELSFQSPPVSRLYFDNQDGAEAEVVCGEVQLNIPANETGHFSFPTPAQQGMPLKFNGKEVGTIGQSRWGASYLLDTSGNNTYRFRMINYQRQFPGLDREEKESPPWADEKTFEKAFLHTLPREVDYFLQPAPKSIKVKMDMIADWKAELLKVQ